MASNHQPDWHNSLGHLPALLALQPQEQAGAKEERQQAVHQPAAPAVGVIQRARLVVLHLLDDHDLRPALVAEPSRGRVDGQ